MSLMKYCKKCGKLIEATKTRCDECNKDIQSKQREYNKTYDMYVRDKSSTKFYNSPAWKAKRKQMVHLYDYIDIYRWYMDGEIAVGDIVHHIVPLKEDRTLSLDSSNLICLSDRTHKYIHACYDMNNDKKIEIQKLLYELIERWERDNTPCRNL